MSRVLLYVYGHVHLDSLCVSVHVHGYAHAYVFCLRVNAHGHVYGYVDGCVYVYACAFLSLL